MGRRVDDDLQVTKQLNKTRACKCIASKVRNHVRSKSVPPAIAGGSAIGIQIDRDPMLNSDPPAIAGGSDCVPGA